MLLGVLPSTALTCEKKVAMHSFRAEHPSAGRGGSAGFGPALLVPPLPLFSCLPPLRLMNGTGAFLVTMGRSGSFAVVKGTLGG